MEYTTGDLNHLSFLEVHHQILIGHHVGKGISNTVILDADLLLSKESLVFLYIEMLFVISSAPAKKLLFISDHYVVVLTTGNLRDLLLSKDVFLDELESALAID